MNLNPLVLYKNIAALLKIKSEGTKLMNEIKEEGVKKAGWKTSEFWLSILGIGSTIAVAAAPFIPVTVIPWLITASAVITVAYNAGRVVAKATPTPKDDAFLDALAAKIAPLIKLELPK